MQITIPQPTSNIPFGTAGYRADASLLDPIIKRCGIFMAQKSLIRPRMIILTASHNKSTDNGVKLIIDDDEISELETFMNATTYTLPSPNNCLVYIAHDTRESAKRFVDILQEVGALTGCKFVNLGLMTTPEAHYFIETNPNYWDHLKSVFHHKPQRIYKVDCANGVGTLALKKLSYDNLILYNTNIDIPHMLNHECGADYVEKTKRLPFSLDSTNPNLGFSIDGDGDRVIAFTTSPNNQPIILDGTRIAILYAMYISQKYDINNMRCAIVLTHYANGAAVKYIQTHLPAFEIIFTQTGVRHLHKEAEKYDIAIYFEANGHGTILSKTIPELASKLNQYTGDAIANMLLIIEILENHISLDQWINAYTYYYSYQAKLPLSSTITNEVISEITKKYHGARGFVRPSGTEPIVRLYLEAPQENDIQNIINQLPLTADAPPGSP